MIRLFQANVGSYLTLDRDVLPTDKVSELCLAVRSVSREPLESQVLLTSEGRQMESGEPIGSYSVGTESKPVFVFFRSCLSSSKPPVLTSRLQHSSDLHRQLELLRQKPSPSHFQRQTPLAKRLGDRAVELTQQIKLVLEEYGMQYNGWQSARINCNNMISAFKTHQEVFAKAVESFEQLKPKYEELLERFPSQIELLQQLPLPASPQAGSMLAPPTSSSSPASTSSSLYDWISSHDEKNNLLDLRTECHKALAQVEEGKLHSCLEAAQEILASTDPSSLSLELQLKQRLSDSRQLQDQATELTTIQTGLAQSMHVTSQRALRSGEASTIADLSISHHRSLQMMAQQNSQLEDILRKVEEAKVSLTGHIHHRLRETAQLQMRVAQCNSQLVLQHERIKLTRRRFEVLKQVVSAPKVLATVIGEVGRRRGFNSALQNKAEEVAGLLHRARAEEKELRRSFQSSCGQHFVTSLFPELKEKLPDITVHLPRSLSASHVSQGSSEGLDTLREHLPEDMRPPPTPTHSMLLESTTSSLLSQSSVAVQTDEKGSGESGQTAGKGSGNSHAIVASQPVQGEKLDSGVSVGTGSGIMQSGGSVGMESAETGSGGIIGMESGETGSGVSVRVVSGSQWESGVQYDMYHSAQSKLFESSLNEGSVKMDTPVNTEVLLAAIEEPSREMSVQTDLSVILLEHISVQTEASPVESVSIQTSPAVDESCAQTDITDWETELELTKSQQTELLQKIHELSAEKETLHRTCEDLEEKVSSLNEKEQAFSRLKDSLDHLEQQCSDQCQELKETRNSQAKKLAEYEEKLSQSVLLQMEVSQHATDQEQLLQAQCEELSREIKELKEEKVRQLSRHQQAQSTLNSMRAQLDQAELRITLKQALESKLELAEDKLRVSLQNEEKLRENVLGLSEACEYARKALLGVQEREEENRKELNESKQRSSALETDLCDLQEHCEVTEAQLAETEQKLKDSEFHSKLNESLLTEAQTREREKLESENLSLQRQLSKSEKILGKAQTELRNCESALEDTTHEKQFLESNCAELKSKLVEEEDRVINEKERVKFLEAKLAITERDLRTRIEQVRKLEIELNYARPQVEKSQATISLIQTNLATTEKKLTEERQSKLAEIKALRECLDETRVKLQKSEQALTINDEKLLEARETIRLTEEKLKSTEEKLSLMDKELVETKSSTLETIERLKQAMESERELKELRREMSQGSSPPGSMVAEASKTGANSAVAAAALSEQVSLSSVHIGSVLLFMNDAYGNYIGVTVDRKLYYLNQSCVATLQDVAALVPQLGLKRKLLLGRITERVLVEVRKENNRLRVPVGSRLYKVQAEAVLLS